MVDSGDSRRAGRRWERSERVTVVGAMGLEARQGKTGQGEDWRHGVLREPDGTPICARVSGALMTG